jgi:Glyoxalase/Bleomycin resistance protein/Dioxygenase superfamily
MTSESFDRLVDRWIDVLKSIDDARNENRQVTGMEAVDEISLQTERLRSTAAIQLRIVDLQLGAATIELTAYITPKGRPMSSDARSNDRWFQHIAIVVSDIERAHKQLHAAQFPLVSAEISVVSESPLEFARQFVFQDPDRHIIRLVDSSKKATVNHY